MRTRALERLLDLLGHLCEQTWVDAELRDKISEVRSAIHDELDRRD